jgi:hypothetical protein
MVDPIIRDFYIHFESSSSFFVLTIHSNEGSTLLQGTLAEVLSIKPSYCRFVVSVRSRWPDASEKGKQSVPVQAAPVTLQTRDIEGEIVYPYHTIMLQESPRVSFRDLPPLLPSCRSIRPSVSTCKHLCKLPGKCAGHWCRRHSLRSLSGAVR